MRLGPFDTSKINVRSSDGSGGGGMGRAGGVGCGTLVIALIGAVVFGLDPSQTIGLVESVQQQTTPAGQGSGGRELDAQVVCTSSDYATEACSALTNLNDTWSAAFAEAGVPFEAPGLDLFRGQVNTEGCGSARRRRGRSTARLTRASTSTPVSTISLHACPAPGAILRGCM